MCNVIESVCVSALIMLMFLTCLLQDLQQFIIHQAEAVLNATFITISAGIPCIQKQCTHTTHTARIVFFSTHSILVIFDSFFPVVWPTLNSVMEAYDLSRSTWLIFYAAHLKDAGKTKYPLEIWHLSKSNLILVICNYLICMQLKPLGDEWCGIIYEPIVSAMRDD